MDHPSMIVFEDFRMERFDRCYPFTLINILLQTDWNGDDRMNVVSEAITKATNNSNAKKG